MFLGLSIPLTTIFTYLAAIMGINMTDIYKKNVSIKRTADSVK
jgi:hypothetical protein